MLCSTGSLSLVSGFAPSVGLSGSAANARVSNPCPWATQASTLTTRLNLLVSGFYLTLGLGSRITLLSQGFLAAHLVTTSHSPPTQTLTLSEF